MLRKTWGKLELISDPAMFEMIDGGIRGGVAMITTRYSRANNEGMGELYDATKPASTIKGLDANNLYGWAMSVVTIVQATSHFCTLRKNLFLD